MRPFNIEDFVRESNRIEGIERNPTLDEIEATENFSRISPKELRLDHLVALVRVFQPDARPRFERGMNVYVGSHVPMPGGPNVRKCLEAHLACINTGFEPPHNGHHIYEVLHPFTDGNGRSGRALWLLLMGGIEQAPLGFLHHWYYQSLENSQFAASPRQEKA